MPCRALGAFGLSERSRDRLRQAIRLNALSGIGCVRTTSSHALRASRNLRVLMPCRALGAFGPAGVLTLGQLQALTS